MKIQELAIIFIIIILPISLILSAYTQFQIQTLNLQTLYDTKLTSATFDAIKAFQLNTANSTTSNLANSKLRDIEASISTFKTSIASAFGLNGISEEEMQEYIPALVYTMYDGFYVYSPYTNKNDLGINNDGKTIFGLKPYISYSCQYKYGSNNDIIITYSLDNYISIKGMINGKYINDEGYLIDGITEEVDGTIKYNGIAIKEETDLKEFVSGIEYPYRKINGTKYYYDNNGTTTNNDDRIFYLSNGKKVTQGNLTAELAVEYYNKVINNNTSAIEYYREAMEFTERVKNYGFAEISYNDAYDTGNIYDRETKQQIWKDNDRKVFVFNDSSDASKNIECELSNFTQHKLAVIRNVIEKNLATVIANYNNVSGILGVDFQMPQLNDEEWDNVIKNISLISFVQGIPIGGKIYNGYTIVNNTESKEVVKEEDIYIIGNDQYYHRVGEKFIENEDNINQNVPIGRLKLDFNRTSILDATSEPIYYYPRNEYASYDSVVTQNSEQVTTYDDIYAYIANSDNTALKSAFYTALGRERNSMYKVSNNTSEYYSVLVLGTASNISYQSKISKFTEQLNEKEGIHANYVFSADTTYLSNYIKEQKNKYNLIIIDSFVWPLGISTSILSEVSNATNLITISNDAVGLPMMQSSTTANTTVQPQITDLGKKKLENISIASISDNQATFKFKNDVEVFYTGTYSGNITGEYDLIGCWQNGRYKWIHSQISLNNNNVNEMRLLELLVNYAIH